MNLPVFMLQDLQVVCLAIYSYLPASLYQATEAHLDPSLSTSVHRFFVHKEHQGAPLLSQQSRVQDVCQEDSKTGTQMMSFISVHLYFP